MAESAGRRNARGPLAGVRVLELAGLGPGPFAALLLAELGADVLRVDRRGGSTLGLPPRFDLLRRSRPCVEVDLRSAAGRDAVLALVGSAEVLIEGFRPGVCERLGVGPDDCWAVNPALVYGRMTGWGQTGPLAATAGHDLTYLAVSGALHAMGRPGSPPTVPTNVVGDFGGGSLYLVVGVLAALLSARATGVGQVVDAAIVDGAASLTTMLHGMLALGVWRDEPGVNLLDGGVPWYDVYEAADGRYVAVGALEPQFFAELCRLLRLAADESDRVDPSRWPALRAALAERFATRTRDEWEAHFAGSDACVAPVLSLAEAARHPQAVARGAFVEVDGIRQPAAAPRFSRTPGSVRPDAATRRLTVEQALAAWAP